MKPAFLPLLAFALLLSCDADSSEEAPEPRAKADGRPYRVAVVQSGDYYFYNAVLTSIHAGLADLQWVAPGNAQPSVASSIPSLLSAWNQGASPLIFDPDLYLDLQFTTDPVPPPALLALLDGTRGADAVLSLGTVAGVLVARAAREGRVRVPVLVESASDPVGSGIVASVEDSGHDKVTATFDPEEYERQIRLFYRIAGFRRLGMIYTDSEPGRAYAALSTVERVAAELGFRIVADTGVLEDPPDESQLAEAERAYVAAFERLSRSGVDAIYLTIQAGLTERTVPLLHELAVKHRVPTFAMEGTDHVRLGILAGESRNVLVFEGRFSASKLVRVLTGQSPRSLPQVMVHTPHIALNLTTARNMGFTVPAEVLLEADEVYTP